MLRSDAQVLIVDGHVAVARLVAKIFGLIGLSEAELAFNSLDAHKQLKRLQPDIVVVDANIAPSRAPMLIALIRALTDGKAVTLLTTTSLDTEIVRAAREAGVDDVLLKPFTPNDLRARLLSAKAEYASANASQQSRQQGNVTFV
nr:response regulator [Methylobacterium sp. L1A1]